MKRLLTLISILTVFAGANASYASQNCIFSCTKPYDMSNRFGSALTKVTGLNIAAEKAAESILKSQITKNAQGDFKVNIGSYSVPDLKAGRFKSLSVHGENVVADGVYFSTLSVNTLCDFNYIVYDKESKTAVFKEDFPLHYAVMISQNDLNNTMKSSGYNEILEKVSTFGKAFSLFDIKSSNVKIRDNKFIYALKVEIPFINSTQEIAVISDLNVENGKISFNNPQLMNKYYAVDFSRITRALNYLNPLEFSLKVFENKNALMDVQNVKIVNNKINIDGTIYIPKDGMVLHQINGALAAVK